MELRPFKLYIYKPEGDRSPFSEWLGGLKDKKTKAILRARINRIRLGNFGDCESLGDGVFEFKIDYGPGFRIYFGRDAKDIVILLYGGIKKTQKRDIDKAKEYWADYKGQKNEEKN